MTKREIAALICKALGIYVFIGALNLLPFLFTGMLIQGLPVILNVVAGLILWRSADKIAGLMVGDSGTVPQSLAVGPEAQIVVFSALGLLTLLQVIPRFGQLAANLYIINQQDALMRRELKGSSAPEILGLIIQLALGLWLLFGASGLVNMLQSFKTVGMDKPNLAAIDRE